MDYKINYSDEALNDLIQIHDYIAYVANEPANAKSLINDIRNAIKKLDTFPLRYPVVSFSPWDSLKIKYFTVKNQIIFYLVNENNLTVNIVRIYSSRRDLNNIFKWLEHLIILPNINKKWRFYDLLLSKS